ncbi:MAG: MFS transporter [Eubacteriales bacterium]|nr:MFS transporter [Eubacteriales bacterium]
MSLMKRLRANPMIDTIVSLRGNQRACLYTEPLWGIPYNLYVPFVSVFMAALGMSPTQIGLVSTIFLASQMVWSLLSGVLTDKLGRRTCTIIFDVLSWSVPSFLWMCSQNFTWFVVAALFNGAWRVTETSWGLLLIEDAPSDKLIHMYSITSIAGLIAGFIAPVAYFFVQKYSVVPTMRVLYGITFVMMTTKFVTLYFLSKETSVGLRRMEETKNVSVLAHLWDSRKVLVRMLHDRRIMITVAFMACYTGMKNINDAFWPLLVTEKLGIPAENLSLFSTLRSLLMLVCYFVIVPRLDLKRFRNPLLIGLSLFVVQEVGMLLMPGQQYPLVFLMVILEAVALSMLNPLSTSLQMINIDREERARMLGFFYALCMLVTSPLTTVAGMLAEMNRTLPFVLNLILTLGGLALGVALWHIGLPPEEQLEEQLERQA